MIRNFRYASFHSHFVLLRIWLNCLDYHLKKRGKGDLLTEQVESLKSDMCRFFMRRSVSGTVPCEAAGSAPVKPDWRNSRQGV